MLRKRYLLRAKVVIIRPDCTVVEMENVQCILYSRSTRYR